MVTVQRRRFGITLDHKSPTLVIVSLTLNALQNIPRAAAFEWTDMAGGACKTIFSKVDSKDVSSVAKAVSNYATFKNLADKLFDPQLLNSPQFGILFRTGMTAAKIKKEL